MYQLLNKYEDHLAHTENLTRCRCERLVYLPRDRHVITCYSCGRMVLRKQQPYTSKGSL